MHHYYTLISHSLEQALMRENEESIKQRTREIINNYCAHFEVYLNDLYKIYEKDVDARLCIEQAFKGIELAKKRSHDEYIKLLRESGVYTSESLAGALADVMVEDDYLSEFFAEEWNVTDLRDMEKGEARKEWSAVASPAPDIKMANIFSKVQGNAECHYVDNDYYEIYLTSPISFLYNVKNNSYTNSIAMYNGCFYDGTGNVKITNLREYLNSYYEHAGKDTIIHDSKEENGEALVLYSMPSPLCYATNDINYGAKYLHKVLPIKLMKEATDKMAEQDAIANEIVINGCQQPYGILYHSCYHNQLKSKLEALKTIDPDFAIYKIRHNRSIERVQ